MEIVTGKNSPGAVMRLLATAASALGLSEQFNGWDAARQERHAQRQAKKQARRPILTMRHISVKEHQFLTAKCAKATARRDRRAYERQVSFAKAFEPSPNADKRRTRGW